MNTFMNTLKNNMNYTHTENGALAHKSTNSAVYDMFAFGGAYRQKSDEDCILLFKNAYEEDPELALKCLFYLRDCRGGQGERRFFRVCFKWYAKSYPWHAEKYVKYLPYYGRYDDLFILFDTPVEGQMIALVKNQLELDMECKENGISLLAKWMPSINTSSAETRKIAQRFIKTFNVTEKQYRKMLSKLREKINVLERLMSLNQWDQIVFDKIPSKAGLIYKNAFARRDIISKKYESFIKDESTTVNADTLYPYEIVKQAIACRRMGFDNVDRLTVNKYWENQKDYLEGADLSMLCVIDTSGSMTWGGSVRPIDVAISLGLYTAERMSGPFANQYISFSSRPQLIKTEGIDFVDKVDRIYKTNLCDNTNLTAVFNLLLNTLEKKNVREADLPKTICIISDMQMDYGLISYKGEDLLTEMETIRKKWEMRGHKLPNLIYWNVNASEPVILDKGKGVSYVSGCSPTIFKSVITGKTGYDLMIETLMSERYANITYSKMREKFKS